MSWFVIALFVAYILIGLKWTFDASKHLRNPKQTYFYTPLLSPEEFTPDGERWRRRALRFWYGGSGSRSDLSRGLARSETLMIG
jgi:hypothetical protein